MLGCFGYKAYLESFTVVPFAKTPRQQKSTRELHT